MQRLDLISQLSLETDKILVQKQISEILSLAREHHLTIYDATYPEVAARLGLPLATKDKALTRAADAIGNAVQ